MASREEKIALLERRRKIAELEARRDADPGIDIGTPAQAALEGFGDSASFGFLPQLQAAAEPAMTAVLDKLTGQDVGSDLPDYDTRVGENEARQAMLEEEAPVASIAGQLGGALAGGGAAGAGVRGATKLVAPKLAASLANAAASPSLIQSTAARVAQNVPEGAVIGALGGLSTGNAGAQALEGGAMDAGLSVLGGGARALGKGGKKLFGALLGPGDQAIDDFFRIYDDIKPTDNIDDIRSRAVSAIKRVKQAEVTSRLDLNDDIRDAMVAIKERGFHSRNEALKILDASDLQVSKKQVQDVLDESLSRFKRHGKMVGQASKSAARKMEALKQDISSLPDNLSARDVKSIIEDIDAEITFQAIPGQRATRVQQALMESRKGVDDLIKPNVPGYAEAIGEAEKSFKFFEEAADQLGTPEKVDTAIRALGKPGKEIKNDVIERLAKEENIRLSYFKRAQKQAQLLSEFNEKNVEDKVLTFLNKDTELMKKQLQVLESVTDEEFVRAIDRARVLRQFDHEFLRGSRNVNMWTALSAGGLAVSAGLVSGDPVTGVGLGGIVGSLAGAMVDKHGPRTARGILTAIAKVKGIPTVRKVLRLDAPSDVKNILVDQLRRGFIAGSTHEAPVHIPVALRADVAKEIQDSDSMTNSEKAKAIAELNKRGTVQNLAKIMDPDPPKEDRKPAVEQRKNKTSALDLKKFNSNLSGLARKPEY